MSSVMSSWGIRPGTSPLTWMPYGPHSTARVSTMFLTPAFAAALWAKPGPPVQAYDAPTLMIEAGVSAARCRRPNSRATKKVPLRVMSTTVRHALGDMSSAGTGKLAAALLIKTLGIPNAASAASNAVVIDSGSRMSHSTVVTRAPRSVMACSPASRCSGFREAMTMSAPRRANSEAIAFPRPVPPPVTNTLVPSKVPAGRALVPTGGGAGRPGKSGITTPGSSVRVPRLGQRGTRRSPLTCSGRSGRSARLPSRCGSVGGSDGR